MSMPRRDVLRLVPFTLGLSAIVDGNGFTAMAQTAANKGAEKVTGIGGFFFRAHDPEALGRWYQERLGISLTPSSYQDPVWRQEAGPTVLSPFPDTTDYFGDPHKVWMINFRVRDLDKMVAQLRAAKIDVKVDPKTYPNGRFAALHDPEGNPIQLWQAVNPNAP